MPGARRTQVANAAGVSKGVRIREALDKGTAEVFTLIGKGSIHFHKKIHEPLPQQNLGKTYNKYYSAA